VLLCSFSCVPYPFALPMPLARILEEAYIASMEREEGRPARFALILQARGDTQELRYGITPFQERRPLTSTEIRGLAPITGPSTFIAVDSSGSEPLIWGTIDNGFGVDPAQRGQVTTARGSFTSRTA
jgi:hypothetical protein